MVLKTNCVLGSFSIHDCDAIQNITDNINLHSLKLARSFSISLSLSNAGNFLKFHSSRPRPSSPLFIYVNHKFHVQLYGKEKSQNNV